MATMAQHNAYAALQAAKLAYWETLTKTTAAQWDAEETARMDADSEVDSREVWVWDGHDLHQVWTMAEEDGSITLYANDHNGNERLMEFRADAVELGYEDDQA